MLARSPVENLGAGVEEHEKAEILLRTIRKLEYEYEMTIATVEEARRKYCVAKLLDDGYAARLSRYFPEAEEAGELTRTAWNLAELKARLRRIRDDHETLSRVLSGIDQSAISQVPVQDTIVLLETGRELRVNLPSDEVCEMLFDADVPKTHKVKLGRDTVLPQYVVSVRAAAAERPKCE